ncbi:hypothetical protein M434DRAFT_32017 [Hypoxylon sp. CO27-5]|nr:hypothetical protein M434DRAFT_32017 [Hypoxylon sp. CO27-5]
MAPKLQLHIPISLNRRNLFHSIHLTPATTYGPVYEKSKAQLQLKGAEERLTSNTPALCPGILREVEDVDFDDDGSIYDSEKDEAEITEVTAQSIPKRESFDDQHNIMCSPDSYTEFTINPYSWSGFTTVDRLQYSTENKKPESKRDCSSLSRTSSKKGMGANLLEACQRSVRRRTQNMEGIREVLSKNLSTAYNVIKAEGSASLQFLGRFRPWGS